MKYLSVKRSARKSAIASLSDPAIQALTWPTVILLPHVRSVASAIADYLSSPYLERPPDTLGIASHGYHCHLRHNCGHSGNTQADRRTGDDHFQVRRCYVWLPVHERSRIQILWCLWILLALESLSGGSLRGELIVVICDERRYTNKRLTSDRKLCRGR